MSIIRGFPTLGIDSTDDLVFLYSLGNVEIAGLMHPDTGADWCLMDGEDLPYEALPDPDSAILADAGTDIGYGGYDGQALDPVDDGVDQPQLTAKELAAANKAAAAAAKKQAAEEAAKAKAAAKQAKAEAAAVKQAEKEAAANAAKNKDCEGDGNNGHGNDEDGVDESNPGKSKK